MGSSVVPSDLAHRRALLTAALGFALPRTRDGSAPPETETLRKWLDTRRGVADVVTGMHRQSYMLHLSNVDASTWRATFGREAMLSSDGFGDRADAVAGGAGSGVGGAGQDSKRSAAARDGGRTASLRGNGDALGPQDHFGALARTAWSWSRPGDVP